MNGVYITYLLPALIIAACVIGTLLFERRRKRRAAVLAHSQRIADEALTPAPTDPAAESAWHRLHAPELQAWMSAHEERLDRASADGFTNARAVLDAPDPYAADRLDNVVAAHPNPLRRAELSALLAAARSTLAAIGRADYTRARHHHLVYRDYREIWRQHEPAAAENRLP